jgi:hypothetical protein
MADDDIELKRARHALSSVQHVRSLLKGMLVETARHGSSHSIEKAHKIRAALRVNALLLRRVRREVDAKLNSRLAGQKSA